MCGASFMTGHSGMDAGFRRLVRNTSCSANNGHFGITAGDDRSSVQPASSSDAWGSCSGQLSCISSDSMLVQTQVTGSTAPQSGPCMPLLLGTSAGLFQLDLSSQQVQLLGLESTPVAFVTYSPCGLVLAACKAPEEAVQASSVQQAAAEEAAGLYCLDVRGRRSSCDSSGSSNCSGIGSSMVHTLKLWDGNASCCAFAPMQQPQDGVQPLPRIYVGTQPADVFYSDDFGDTWAPTGLSDLPEAENFFMRLPPYEPSLRSISCVASSSQAGTSTAAGLSQQQEQQEQQPSYELLVGVEVGGVMQASHLTACNQQCDWKDSSQGLCRDIHAVQPDPFNPQRLYAVAGSGHLPGGLYRCRGKGQKWKRLFGYRYSVGMAVSAYQKGRMLLVSADKPPAIGCNLFESVDSGRNWINLTDDVADAAAALTDHEPGLFDGTALAMFVQGGLIIACATGHIFLGTSKPLGGYSSWKLLAKLPAAISCMCSMDITTAPVSITRF